MKKGFSPFSFISFFVLIFVGTSFIMSGTGWTGFEDSGTFEASSCNDVISCTALIFANMVKLFTFQSQYILFNMVLIMFYILLPLAVISVILGGS